MKRVLVGITTLALIALAGSAFAGTQDNAKIGLHIQPKAAKASTICTTSAPSALRCDGEAETSGLITEAANLGVGYDVYVVILDVNMATQIGGSALGLGGTAVDVFGWTLCADLEFASAQWPNVGGSNSITYNTLVACGGQADASDPQGDGIAVLGAVYVYPYSPQTLAIVPRPDVAVPDLTVADCSAVTSDITFPLFAGVAGFGGEPGYQPCVSDGTPVENTTWGAIKKGLGE